MAVNPPTAGTLDYWNLTNGGAVPIYRADAFKIGELVTYQNLAGLLFFDSPDAGQSPRTGYGAVGVFDADCVKLGIYASSTQGAVLIASLSS